MKKKLTPYSIEKKQARWGFLFTVPCLVFFAVFSFYPIISAFITSLTNRDAIRRTYDFIGFQNYTYLFTQSNGGFSLLNSLKATAIFMHTSGKDYQWLTNNSMLRASTIIVYFWKYIGYFTILFITGLASIPPTIYEAAIVDGSSRWHTFWKITLPLLKPTVVLVSIMAMLQCLKTFSTQYMFVQGGTAREPIDVITMNIYYTGVVNRRLGRSSAMSIILFLIMLCFTYLQFSTQKGGDDVEY